jgi:hypothetical protein
MMQADRGRHLIDYDLVKHRFRNQVRKCKTYPGADRDSDNNKVLKCKLKYKRMVKEITKWNVRKLRDTEVRVG